MFHGPKCCLETIWNAYLPKNVIEMSLYRVTANIELISYFLVTCSDAYKSEHLHLSLSEIRAVYNQATLFHDRLTRELDKEATGNPNLSP